MVVLNAFVTLALIVIVVIGFPAVMYVMGKMIMGPFFQAQRRDRERALAATSPAPRQRHLVLVKSVNAGVHQNVA